jgi:outer membrane protein assembly factor BamA
LYLTFRIIPASFLIALFIQLCIAEDSIGEQPQPKELRISKINIYGNRTTKSKAIKLLMGLDTAAIFDSLQLRIGEKRLEETNLFSKVDVFVLKKEQGVEIFIIVVEKVYISPSGGGTLFSYKYGEKNLWLRLELGLRNNNFRGMMEDLNTSISVWDWRSFSFSWSKPLLPSDFFFTVGSGVYYYPDEVLYTDHFVFSNRFRFGRKIKNRTRVSIGLNPTFRKDIYTLKNAGNENHQKLRLETSELFSSVFWISDYRKPYFDPCHGWLGFAEIKSNHLYPGGFSPFAQLTTNFAFYHSGFSSSHKVAYRFQSVLRNDDAGPFHTLELGCNGSLRGYSSAIIGLYLNGNNSLLFSMEYRFPLFFMPPIDIPILSKRNKQFSALRQRIDGALIFDYGRVSTTAKSLLGIANGPIESGAGIGIGIRSMILNLERSLAMDIVWGKDNTCEMLKFKKTPVIHTYIDLYF